MITLKNYSKFVVFVEDNMSLALSKISENKSRIIFVVTSSGHLEGVLTDGDVRRWLTSSNEINLDVSVSKVMNRKFVSAAHDTPREKIMAMMTPSILALPMVDDNNRLVAVTLPSALRLQIGTRTIAEDAPCFIIAEIGNNHNGSLEAAINLIDLAANAGVDCAKFQMRDMKTLYHKHEKHGDAGEDLGAQYTLDLLAKFQLTDDDLYRAFDHCAKRGLEPMCTPWDEASLEKLEAYGVPAYKVASADFTNYALLSQIASKQKPMLCSTGMSTEAEISESVRHLESVNAPYVLLHCNSTYPTPDKDVNLRYMQHLRGLSRGLVGYSGHERGINVPIAAVALGAKVIEKHFTTDRGLEGNDHKVSLLPEELSAMVQAIRQIEVAMGTDEARTISQGELMNREVLAKSLVAGQDIPAGVEITEAMLDTKSPGKGLQPNRLRDLLGRKLRSPKAKGDFFFESDLSSVGVTARNYSFDAPWGIPVRYHDLEKLRSMSNMDLVEIHLSYKDMEEDFQKYIPEPLDLGLVVHAPELFAGDHTLDLCTSDEDYRRHSLKELARVAELTRKLAPYFKKTERPCIVTNVGGFTHHGHLSRIEAKSLYKKVHASLQEIDLSGVEIIPQTMPPYPWHFGGQQFHNIFTHADEIVEFCEMFGMRICMDVSHSKLSCNHQKVSLASFLKKVAPYTAHYHIADAKGVDGEGLQIGEGEIDWIEFFNIYKSSSPSATFIPEIWQGHKNNGEGAWIALERLDEFSNQENTDTTKRRNSIGL